MCIRKKEKTSVLTVLPLQDLMKMILRFLLVQETLGIWRSWKNIISIGDAPHEREAGQAQQLIRSSRGRKSYLNTGKEDQDQNTSFIQTPKQQTGLDLWIETDARLLLAWCAWHPSFGVSAAGEQSIAAIACGIFDWPWVKIWCFFFGFPLLPPESVWLCLFGVCSLCLLVTKLESHVSRSVLQFRSKSVKFVLRPSIEQLSLGWKTQRLRRMRPCWKGISGRRGKTCDHKLYMF